MKNLNAFAFPFFTTILLLVSNVDGQLEPKPQRPLCVSQLALVNYACGNIQLTPPVASHPFTVVFTDDDSNHRHRHEHGHRHGHGHGHSHSGILIHEDNCCRWLNNMDDECVCELLAHLPPFLSRPWHEYAVKVHDSCRVSYTCGFK
ncbi:unnamed protein product [Dovyalis caffra]|uniref:Uncharacterized protein n=1 Tax=Dovyalis caffra TaxID=77055 RepID=A0AAV1S7P0_9ROSI|nr:unnamed protein product [Dovyalis caffra]